MSYSDYGSYNWGKGKGEWVYQPKFEDRSLITKQPKKTLEALFGLKLDAVLSSKQNEAKFKDLPYSIKSVHHSVIGDLKHFAVVSYKGTPTILWKGKEIATISYNDTSPTKYIKGKEVLKQNFTPKVIEIFKKRDNCYVKVLIDTSNNKYWSVAYIRNDNKEFLSICGYGLGKHFWLDEQGFEIPSKYEEKREFELKKRKTKKTHWIREKEALKRCLKLLKLSKLK